MREYRDRFKDHQTGPHRALLAGALSIATIREFAACVGAVFPDNELVVGDIEGIDTKAFAEDGPAQFQYANVISLDGSLGEFNTIHTNYLLRSLIAKVTDRDTARRIFFQGAHRLLVDNGRLIMAELGSPEDAEVLTEELLGTGFSSVMAYQFRGFRDRRSLDAFIGGTNPIPLPEDIELGKRSALLVAVK